MARDFNTTYDEAKRRVLKTDADRRAFVRKYFHEDLASALNYDLVINMESLSVETAVESIRGALGK